MPCHRPALGRGDDAPRLLGPSWCAERLEQGNVRASVTLVRRGVCIHLHRETSETRAVVLGVQPGWIL